MLAVGAAGIVLREYLRGVGGLGLCTAVWSIWWTWALWFGIYPSTVYVRCLLDGVCRMALGPVVRFCAPGLGVASGA